MQNWLERVWYGGGRGGAWLRPLALLYRGVTAIRHAGYASGLFRSIRIDCPVVIVGNLSVGGSGKTPLVAWLVDALTSRDIRVGIISRGYGGSARGPLRVNPDTDPALAGDEPVLLATQTGVPVAIARDRVAAAELLAGEVDLLIADDGLQHYRLARDLEIVVIDGVRRFGNARLLPAGPLREPTSRLRDVDFVVTNGGRARAGEISMTLVPGALIALEGGERKALGEFAGQRVHAIAAIGNPGRFFAALRAAGLDPIEHPLSDHAPVGAGDLEFGDGLPVLMTGKDAVKCRALARPGLYWLEVTAALSASDGERLLARIRALVRD